MLQAEHLDEGTLNAFLDGELDSDQLAEVDRHLAECPECRRQADEARAMLDEADELIERLDPPPFVMLPESRSMGGGGRPEPVVLIPPEPETPRPGTGRPYRPTGRRPERPFAPPRAGRRAAIAAGLVAVVGLGYLLTRGDDSPQDARLAQMQVPSEQTMSSFERTTPEESLTAVPGTGATIDSLTAMAMADAEAATDEALTDETESAAEPEPEQVAAAPPPAPRREEPAEPQPSAAEIARARQAAADRAAAEAERDVAARTQARLEQEAQQAGSGRAAAAAAAAPPPDPMSALERRAGVYSRIGLDEARRMLGSPAHAILDLRPQFVGLAPSSGVPGADPGRPLVRVVYLDPSQRLIMLDQQRQSGDLPPSTDNLRIMTRGGVRLWLHGGVPPAALRDLAERVR